MRTETSFTALLNAPLLAATLPSSTASKPRPQACRYSDSWHRAASDEVAAAHAHAGTPLRGFGWLLALIMSAELAYTVQIVNFYTLNDAS